MGDPLNALTKIYRFVIFNMYQLFKPHYSTPVNPLNAELNPICHLLALLGARPIFHISRIRVNKHSSKQYLLDLKIMVKFLIMTISIRVY